MYLLHVHVSTTCTCIYYMYMYQACEWGLIKNEEKRGEPKKDPMSMENKLSDGIA